MKAQSSSKTAPKNISVFLRVRPPVPREKDHTFRNIEFDPADDRAAIMHRKSGSKMTNKRYLFNKVFKASSTQKEIYEAYAKNAVEAAFDGQHGVLFVYGQTGSGKTFTISNEDPKNEGVLQQSMKEIWGRIAADKESDYTLSVSYVQLYNEILTDLLDDAKGRVRIQLGTEGRGDVVLVAESTGLPVEKPVTDYAVTMKAFYTGMKRKEMQSTSMNTTSSRSHTVFTLNIKKSRKVTAVRIDGGMDEDLGGTVALEGRLVLCDLAGSERVSKTHAEGKTLDEATHINSSLLVLGKVVAALTEKHSQHAPFRESKLTRILQYSLLGNGNTALVVNISPSDDNTEESLSAVGFGQRAIQIKQDAKRHEVLDYKALYLQLMAELDAKNDRTLEDALAEERMLHEDRVTALQDQVTILTEENGALRYENGQLRAGVPPDKVAQVAGGGGAVGVGGGGGGSFAGGGGTPGRSSAANQDWREVSQSMREMLVARDARISSISEDRTKLALLLASEKDTCFKLAKKMQELMRTYTLEKSQLLRRQDELTAELAGAKGTDYLNAMGAMDSMGSPAGQFADPNGGAFPGDESERTNQLLRAYRAERIEMIVYQAKASRAIRLLYAEKEAVRRTK